MRRSPLSADASPLRRSKNPLSLGCRLCYFQIADPLSRPICRRHLTTPTPSLAVHERSQRKPRAKTALLLRARSCLKFSSYVSQWVLLASTYTSNLPHHTNQVCCYERERVVNQSFSLPTRRCVIFYVQEVSRNEKQGVGSSFEWRVVRCCRTGDGSGYQLRLDRERQRSAISSRQEGFAWWRWWMGLLHS